MEMEDGWMDECGVYGYVQVVHFILMRRQVETSHSAFDRLLTDGPFFVFLDSLYITLSHISGKASTESFYKPFLLGINVFYMILRWLISGWKDFLSVTSVVVLVTLFGLQWYAYQGILDRAATAASAATRKKSNDTSLVGGSSLDLLGLVLVIQFGALFVSPKFYYLLAVIPVWAAYAVYNMLFAGSKKAPSGSSDASSAISMSQRDGSGGETRPSTRAERRKQK